MPTFPRIAWFSPVNPVPSGISDYTEELLPYLTAWAQVDLIVDDGVEPTNPHLVEHLEVVPVSRFEARRRRVAYDALVYHMGNSPAHAYVYEAIQRWPGILVLHDLVLHHFFLWYAFNRGRPELYLDALARRGEAGRRVAERMSRGQLLDAAFDHPLVELILPYARGVLAHSRYVLEAVAPLAPDLPRARVPMGVPPQPALDRSAARRALGVPEEALVVASFGHANPYKRLETALRAFRALVEDRPDARFWVVGSLSPHLDLRETVSRLGLDGRVRLWGHVPRPVYYAAMAAADLAVNLRHPSAGETSASLLRLLAAGLPTLVSDTAAFAELPRHVVAHVPVGPLEEPTLTALLRHLAAWSELRRALGAHARAFVAAEHTLEASAAAYARVLSAWTGIPFRRLREPLWSVEVEVGDPPPRPAEGAREGPWSSVLARVGDALAGWGVGEDEEGLLTPVARALAELGYGEEEEVDGDGLSSRPIAEKTPGLSERDRGPKERG